MRATATGLATAAIVMVIAAAGCGGDPDLPPPPPGSSQPPSTPPPGGPTPSGDPAAEAAAAGPKMPSAPTKRPGQSSKKAAQARPSRPATGDVSDGPDPQLSTLIAFAGPRPEVDVTPLSAREDAKFLVTPSPLGSSSLGFVVPPNDSQGGSPRPPEGYRAADAATTDEQGRPSRIVPLDGGPEMVLVPGGAFRFGDRAAGGEAGLTVSAFYIDRTEVTLAEWTRYREAVDDRVPAPLNAGDPPDFPATGLRLRDVTQYAEWIGKAIPTEVQWEKAARGAMSLPNVWGRGRPLWSAPRRPGELHAVGAYPGDRSVYGAMDLAGNAREWTLDPWDADPYSQAEGTTDWSGPRRPRSANERVVRGEADGFSVITRDAVNASATDRLIGFRCVLPASPASASPERQ